MRQKSTRTRLLPGKQVHRSWTHTHSACRNADQWLKHSLTSNLDSLVALALIVALLVGSLVLTGFLAVRIGQPAVSTADVCSVTSVIWAHQTCTLSVAGLLLSCHHALILQGLCSHHDYLFTPSPNNTFIHTPTRVSHFALQNMCFGLACKLQC